MSRIRFSKEVEAWKVVVLNVTCLSPMFSPPQKLDASIALCLFVEITRSVIYP